MKQVYLCGSFKQLPTTEAIAVKLQRANITTAYSKPGDPKGIDGCLTRIDESEVIFVVNPDGNVGKSVALDIGYALAKNKIVYSLTVVEDPPVSHLIAGVCSPEDLIGALKDGELDSTGSKVETPHKGLS